MCRRGFLSGRNVLPERDLSDRRLSGGNVSGLPRGSNSESYLPGRDIMPGNVRWLPSGDLFFLSFGHLW